MISAEGSARAVLTKTARWHVGHGDALELTRELPDNSIDALVTDPPGGIEFMGKEWDKAARGTEAPLVVRLRATLAALATHSGAEPERRELEREWFIWWLSGCLAEACRVLKPGAHGLIWSIPRTTHWTGMAIEYAGFEIIDQIDHLFSQGASKSKSARRMLAMEDCALAGRHFESALPPEAEREEGDHVCAEHVEPTEWDGHGTGLAPSHESWYLVRKPLDGTIAENLKKWGTGVIDIDGSRIPVHEQALGRWPKNTVVSHGPGCAKRGTAFVLANPSWDTPERDTAPALFTGPAVSPTRHVSSRSGEPSARRRYTGRGSASLAKTPGARRDEVEEVDVWECEPGCAVAALAEQGGSSKSGSMRAGTRRATRNGMVYGEMIEQSSRTDTPADAGSVTRFYLQLREEPFVPYRYEPKPPRAEKEAGLRYFRRRTGAEATGSQEGQARLANARTGAGRTGGAKNSHNTVKGVKWMRYAVRLVCPPGGVVLDQFTGSGSTGVGAILEDRRFIGFELHDSDEEPHVQIARARIQHADGTGELVPRASLQEPSVSITLGSKR